MRNSNNDTRTRRGYCPRCGETREITVTVPWQDDLCTKCGNSVPAE